MDAGTQCEHGAGADPDSAAAPDATRDGQGSPSPPPTTRTRQTGSGVASPGAPPDPTAARTSTTTASASASSPALLHNILSRVRMLGRARASRASEGAVPGPGRTADAMPTTAATPEPPSAPAPRRIGSDAIASTSAATTPAAVRHRRGASAGLEAELAELASHSAARRTAAAEASDSDSVLSTASSGFMVFDPSDSGMNNLKAKDLGPFCEQLDRLLDYIHSTKDLNNLIYTYPSKLQDSLDAKANELHTIYLEARAARIRIQQVKNQRKAVRKECKATEKILNLLKEEEIKEMENYITLYDKTLMSRWEKIRSSAQEDVVDSFILDIKGKQKALEYLHTLATNKLNKLHKSMMQPTATEESKPVSLALRRLSASSGARSTGRWRNKHHERALRGPASTAQAVDASMPLVPLATAPFSLTLGPTLSATGNNGSSSRLPTSSTLGSASSSLLPNNGLTNLNTQIANGMTSPPTTNIPERQSVLQALFSDIQNHGTHDNLPINAVMPRFVTATSLSSGTPVGGNNGTQNQRENGSGNADNGNDIELYSLHDPT